MPLDNRFYSIRPGESLEEIENRRGISFSELLERLNRLDEHGLVNSCESRDGLENLAETDKLAQNVLKNLRGALNKLAPDNFYVHLMNIQECIPSSNYDLVSIFVDQLIEKAIEENCYSFLYAHVCKALKNIKLKAKQDQLPDFGSMVLNECCRHFTYSLSSLNWFSPNDPNEDDISKILEKDDMKRKMLVNLSRFLGHLYVAGMINAEEIYQYIHKLEENKNEKSIEALCKILTTCGRDLETETFQTDIESSWNITWSRILELSSDNSISLRAKFMLMDLIDLLNSGWVHRIPLETAKTYEEILYENRHRIQEKLASDSKNIRLDILLKSMKVFNSVLNNEPELLDTEKEILKVLREDCEVYNRIYVLEKECYKQKKSKAWFIYTLTRAILRDSISGNSLKKVNFSNHTDLLKKFVSSRHSEVSCMYAVQYIVIREMRNPKGLLEEICQQLYKTGVISYTGFLDWRENWSKVPVLEVLGKAEAHITLAVFFMKLFWDSIKPSGRYKSIVKELNSFDLEHFVSMSRLPPEIGKRIKMEEEREKMALENRDKDTSSTQSGLTKTYDRDL